MQGQLNMNSKSKAMMLGVALVATLLGGATQASAQALSECQVPDKFYFWELPAHCCEQLCDWMWYGNSWTQVPSWWFYNYDSLPPTPENPPPVCSSEFNSCFYSENTLQCKCLAQSGDFDASNQFYEACRASGANCKGFPGEHCMQLEDGNNMCKPSHGVLDFSLTTGLMDLDAGVPSEELQAIVMMGLFGLEDFNTRNSSCGASLRLNHVYRDDLGDLSQGSFFNMASTYNVALVTLRSMDLLYSMSGPSNAYGLPVIAATASGDELWDDPVFRRVHQVSRSSSDLASGLCELLPRLGQRAAAVLVPEKPSEDDRSQLDALSNCGRGVYFQALPYPPADADNATMAAFRGRLADSRASVFVALGQGKGAERLAHVIDQAEQAGRLGPAATASQWIFLDRTIVHVAERLASPAALQALQGALVLDQREIDEDRFRSVVARHWGTTDLSYYSELMPEFTKSYAELYNTVDPLRSQYVRTLGAHLYDAVQLLGHMTCDIFPDAKVPGFYKATRAFWANASNTYDFTVAGLTGDIALEQGSNGRRRVGSQGLQVHVVDLADASTLDLRALGPPAAADVSGLPQLPRSSAVCPAGAYQSEDARHRCCELCPGTPEGCQAAQVCVVPASFVGSNACRCDVGSTLRVMTLLDRDSPAGKAAAEAAEDFNNREPGTPFASLAACDKQLKLEWPQPAEEDLVLSATEVVANRAQVDESQPDATALVVAAVLERRAVGKRLDAVLGPLDFAAAEAVGIVLGASVAFSPLHGGNRFRAADMAPALLRVVPSAEQHAAALCGFHRRAGFRFVNVFALRGGEGLDLLEAHSRVCRDVDDDDDNASDDASVTTLQHVLADESPALAEAAIAAAKARKLNAHVVALGCGEPMLRPLLQAALDEGMLAAGSAWIFPFWDGVKCARSLGPEIIAALDGSLAVTRSASDADLAYDAVAAMARGACAAAPSNEPLVQTAFVQDLRENARGEKAAFVGRSGRVQLDVITGDRSPASDAFTTFNLKVAEQQGDEATAPELIVVADPQQATFTGGSSVVPSDTVPPEVEVVPPTTVRMLNFVLAALCLSASFACLVWTYANRQHPVVRVSQVPFLLLVILGTVLQGASVLFLNVDDTVFGPMFANFACRAHLWLMAIGFELTFAPLFLRLYRISRIMRMSAKMRRNAGLISSKQLMGAVVLACLFDMIVLLAWEVSSSRVRFDNIVTVRDEYGKPLEAVGVCTTGTASEPPYLYIIYGYHLLLLLAGSYVCWMNRGLSSAFSEHQPSANAIITTLQIQSVALPVFFMVREDPAPRIFVQGMMVALVVLPTLAWIFISKWLYMQGRINDTGMGNHIIKDLTTEHDTTNNSNGSKVGFATNNPTSSSYNQPEGAGGWSSTPLPPTARRFGRGKKNDNSAMIWSDSPSSSDSYV